MPKPKPKPTPRPRPTLTHEEQRIDFFDDWGNELTTHMSAYNTITSFEKNVLPEHNTNLNNLKFFKEYYANYMRDILNKMPVIPESGGSIKPKQNKTKKIRNN
jgi:hypothetical protein